MRIVCISDTHNKEVPIPYGDILVHAGDFSMMGRLPEVSAFLRWFESLPHPHKVFIAGNHDWLFERQPDIAKGMPTTAVYLQDSEVTVGGVRIWGSPWQPWFHSWAFNLERGPKILAKWHAIPEGVDVLVTHGPPANILDRVPGGEQVGCEDLAEELSRIRPKLHVFGHIHDSYGQLLTKGTHFVNASICDEAYRPVNLPVVVEL